MIQPVILAAGKGTRMRSPIPKVLHTVAGKPMIQWVLEALSKTEDFKKPFIVVNPNGEAAIREVVGESGHLIIQENTDGPGAAIVACMSELLKSTDPVLILYGDHPFITGNSLKAIAELFLRGRPTIAMFTTTLPDFADWRESFLHFGRVIRKEDGLLEKIVEYKNATQDERAVREVNPGDYCIDVRWLAKALPKIRPNPVTHEYYITDLIEIAVTDGVPILTTPLSPEESLGLNSPEDIKRAEKVLKNTTQITN